MYGICPKSGELAGIVNDFDLASWVTSGEDRTGTTPFMVVTVADIEYKNHTIKISPLSGVDAWFRNGDNRDRDVHISLKRHFHSEYGQDQEVSGRYDRYFSTIQQNTRYWSDFHKSLQSKNHRTRPPRLDPRPRLESGLEFRGQGRSQRSRLLVNRKPMTRQAR